MLQQIVESIQKYMHKLELTFAINCLTLLDYCLQNRSCSHPSKKLACCGNAYNAIDQAGNGFISENEK